MKKVLLIVYAWPPAGGPGVQRCLKFAKYLPQFGWEPIILTVCNPEIVAEDPSLLKDIAADLKVYKTPTLEPFTLFKKLTGRKSEEKLPQGFIKQKSAHSLTERIAFWIRLNLFIPDAKVGWWPFAVHRGKKLIKQHKVSIIFSSGPPQTTHLIGRSLALKTGLPWVADFRDPWADINYFKIKKRHRLTTRIDEWLETRCLKSAAAITTVTKGIVDLLSQKSDPIHCHLLPNGFDKDDFKLSTANPRTPSSSLQIYHGGNIGVDRIPHALLSALKHLRSVENTPAIHLLQAGGCCPEFLEIARRHKITEAIHDLGYLTHTEACRRTSESDLLLLMINRVPNNKHIATGKIFEYMGVGKPILGIGPTDGDAARLLEETGSGKMFDYTDSEGIKGFLNEALHDYEGFRKGFRFECATYSREAITQQLVTIFDGLLSKG